MLYVRLLRDFLTDSCFGQCEYCSHYRHNDFYMRSARVHRPHLYLSDSGISYTESDKKNYSNIKKYYIAPRETDAPVCFDVFNDRMKERNSYN